jgi:hypothetical protein
VWTFVPLLVATPCKGHHRLVQHNVLQHIINIHKLIPSWKVVQEGFTVSEQILPLVDPQQWVETCKGLEFTTKWTKTCIDGFIKQIFT